MYIYIWILYGCITNINLTISQNDKYFPNTDERPCYLEGEPEQIVKALNVIQDKLVNDNPKRGRSQFMVYKLHILSSN